MRPGNLSYILVVGDLEGTQKIIVERMNEIL